MKNVKVLALVPFLEVWLGLVLICWFTFSWRNIFGVNCPKKRFVERKHVVCLFISGRHLLSPFHKHKLYTFTNVISSSSSLCSDILHSTKTPVTTMLTYPWKCTVLYCSHWCWWPNTLIIARALARVIIKVLGHQHQWLQYKTVHFQG